MYALNFIFNLEGIKERKTEAEVETAYEENKWFAMKSANSSIVLCH